MKICSICGEEKELSDFYSQNRKRKSGEKYIYYHPECKECTKNKSTIWISNNYDRYLEIKRKQNTNEVSRAIHREMGRKRRADGRRKEWEEKNKDKLREYNLYRRMHKSHEISEEEKELCKQYFNYSCAYCGMSEEEHKLIYNQQLHMDHVDHNGANDLSNNIPSCKICNSSKYTHSLDDWYFSKDFYTDDRYTKIRKWLESDYKLYIKTKINK